MSISTTTNESLSDALDPAIAEAAQQGRLDDAEIQRLVVLSRDAGYQRSDRVPVKTVEAFEPRSLVSIAMDAQRRREAEMRTAAAAGAVIDPDSADADSAQADTAAGDHPQDEQSNAVTQADSMMPAGENGDAVAADDAANAANAQAETDSETDSDAEAEADGGESSSQGTSQIDFEAGHAAGFEEGRQSGLEEGHATGLEEGRAAGRAEASAQLERAIQAFETAAGKLDGLTGIDSTALGDSIRNAILTLASERAGRAIAEQPDAFADRVESLLAAIRASSGQPVIRLNPGDLGSIQPLVETREKLRHCSFVAAPDLAPGDLTVTVGTIGIDDIILPASQAADEADRSAAAVEPVAAPPEMADAETGLEAEAEAGAEIQAEAETGAEAETDADEDAVGEALDVADIDPESDASTDPEPQTGDDDD
ncbi:FliH/SctL family protein [Alphaproteobacteria bacterium LSUCC0719]